MAVPRLLRVILVSSAFIICVKTPSLDAVPPDAKSFIRPENLQHAKEILFERLNSGNVPFLTPPYPPAIARLKFKNFVRRLTNHLEEKVFPKEIILEARKKPRGLKLGDSVQENAYISALRMLRADESNSSTAAPSASTTSSTASPPMVFNPTTCAVHALGVLNGIQLFLQTMADEHLWAVEMLDATGKWPDGILMGNIVSLGSYDECLDVRADITGDELVVGLAGAGVNMDIFPVPKTFRGKYCKAQIDLPAMAADGSAIVDALGPENVALLIAGGVNPAIGLCLPNSCSAQEAQEAMETAGAGVNFKFIVNERDCFEDAPIAFTGPDYAMMAVLMVIVVLALAGTLVDVRILSAKKALAAKAEKDGKAAADGGIKVLQNDIAVQFLTSFSLYSNGKKILNTDSSSPDNIGCLHGLRFVSMTWVILAHTYAFGGIIPWVNLGSGLPAFLRQWEFTAVANASTAVDTFFVLSGLLVSYVVIKELKRSKGRLRPDPVSYMSMYYIIRYIRLTPAFAIGIGLAATLMRYTAGGPLWGQLIENADLCQKDWWKYLLYAHNYVRPEVDYEAQITCFPQSWYLAVDMQLFLVSPLIIFPMFYLPKLAYFWIGGLTLASIAPGFIIQAQNEGYPPTLLPNNNPLSYFYDIYANTYVRAGPYLIGVALGYFLQNRAKGTVKLPKALVYGGWTAAAAIALAVVYGLQAYFPYESSPPSRVESILYSGLGRVAWASVIAWVIIACHYGYGGPVHAILSWKPFMPLGRLTYCSYLLSIYVQYMFQFSRKDVQYNDHPQMVYWFLGTVTLTTAGAFVYSLLFEAPLMGIVKIITAGLKGQPRQRPPTVADNKPQPKKEQELKMDNGKVNGGFIPDEKPGTSSEPKIIPSKLLREEVVEIPMQPVNSS